jgi:hypothetical protein
MRDWSTIHFLETPELNVESYVDILMVEDQHEGGRRAALKIIAVLPEETGTDEAQRRRLAEEIVQMLRRYGFICDLTIPGEDGDESRH